MLARAARSLLAAAAFTASLAACDPAVTVPTSRPAEVGSEYQFEMGHCGLRSPIDFDGSFWDPVAVGVDPVFFDAAPGTIRLLDEQTAVFTSTGGDAVTLTRHQGQKKFDDCH